VPKYDQDIIQANDFVTALRLLTRLPVRGKPELSRGAQAAWAYPLVGALVGLIAALVASVALWLGLSPYLAAGLAVGTMIIVTGALHEDGLADSADGLWGGWDKDRRLEIMKDSRIGSYGVIALGLSLILRITALGTVFGLGHVFAPLIVASSLSRAGLPAMMSMMDPARSDGLSVSTGRPNARTAWTAVGIVAVLSLILAGGTGLLAAIAAALVTWTAAAIAIRKIGGQTGDILGAAQQLSELAVLMTLSVALA